MINNSVMLYVDIFKSVSDPQNMAFKVTSLLKIVWLIFIIVVIEFNVYLREKEG